MTATAHPPHPVSRAVASVRAELASVAANQVWAMDAAATTATLAEVVAVEAQLAEVKARLLAHADSIDIAGDTGDKRTANWHARLTKTIRPAAFRLVRFATALDRYDRTRAALAEGRIHLEQAHVILDALADLPPDLSAEEMARAENHMIGLADIHDPTSLKKLGRRLVEVIDPAAADAHEAKLLEREEREAAAATRLVIWDDGHGKTHGRFTLDALTGAMLKKHLHALAAPRHRAASGPLGERRPTPERLGQAFTELIQRYPATELPKAGGLNATVVVTMTLETLTGGLKAAQLDTGGVISPALARRLACEARIIPAVLGGKSQVLDLGRANRYASEAQRIAKTIQAGGCEVDGCDAPPGMTHAHHKKRWVDGGTTDLGELIMICPAHHSMAHDQRYDMVDLPTGTYAFHRRT